MWNSTIAADADADLRMPRVVVASGGPYTSADMSIQKFHGVIRVPSQYLRQPLSMVCTNGSDRAPGFSWVRMFLLPDDTDADLQLGSEPLGRMIVNENSFMTTAQIYLDLSSQFKNANTKICIEGAGRPGAVYSWEIRSIGTPLLYMPSYISTVSGGWLTIMGSGFSLRPNENIVDVGQISLPVAESSANMLRVFIPKEMTPGNYDLTVAIRSYRSRAVKLQVIAPKDQH